MNRVGLHQHFTLAVCIHRLSSRNWRGPFQFPYLQLQTPGGEALLKCRCRGCCSWTCWTMMLVSDGAYYLVSILPSIVLQDNRTFFKYLCPIPVGMKVLSRFSVLKQEIKKDDCTECGLCDAIQTTRRLDA